MFEYFNTNYAWNLAIVTALDMGAVASDVPVHYQVNDARAAYTFELGRLSLAPNLDLRSYDFENTTI